MYFYYIPIDLQNPHLPLHGRRCRRRTSRIFFSSSAGVQRDPYIEQAPGHLRPNRKPVDDGAPPGGRRREPEQRKVQRPLVPRRLRLPSQGFRYRHKAPATAPAVAEFFRWWIRGVRGVLHLPGKRFHDFADIRKEIQAETEREAGGNKGVSDKKIRLKIFSPNVLDISLVDLPGITKVPVGGQPSDIEGRIRTMIMSYIKHPSCLILPVTPANADLAKSDALQIAGNANPDGHYA